MARPQMDGRVEGQSPAAPQSCRMEVLRRDGWPSGGTQLVAQSRQRSRTVATQTSAAPAPAAPTQDLANANADSRSQQDGPLGDRQGSEQERPRPIERQRPLPDLLHESGGSSADSSRRGSDAEEERQEQVVGRVAVQLRTIGDEMNTVYLQRRNEGVRWQNWRGLYRGLVAFLADTISTLYQHGLR